MAVTGGMRIRDDLGGRVRVRRHRLLVVLLAAALSLAGCFSSRNTPAATTSSPSCTATPGEVTIATGNRTGVYYELGQGIASLLSSSTSLKTTAVETGASVQNIEDLVSGKYKIAFSLADSAADAVDGKESFAAPQPIQALGRIHSNYTYVVVRVGSEISSVAGMKGKKISTGSPKSGTEVIANRLLGVAGLTPGKDVQTQSLDLTRTVAAMENGSIDGMIFSGGLPTPALTELFTEEKGKVKFLDVSDELAGMQKINSVYDIGWIPASAYGQPEFVRTIVVPNVLLVRRDFPANDACAVTWAIWGSITRLALAHPAAAEFSLRTGPETQPIPLAPGARQAFDVLQ